MSCVCYDRPDSGFVGTLVRAAACAAVVASALLASGAAQARTISPYAAAKPSSAASSSCISDFYGMVQNACNSSQRLQFPITMDGAAGAKTLSVTEINGAYAPTAVTSCTVWTITPSSFTAVATLTFTAVSQTKTATFNVGANATVVLFCDLPPKSGIASIQWMP